MVGKGSCQGDRAGEGLGGEDCKGEGGGTGARSAREKLGCRRELVYVSESQGEEKKERGKSLQ